MVGEGCAFISVTTAPSSELVLFELKKNLLEKLLEKQQQLTLYN